MKQAVSAIYQYFIKALPTWKLWIERSFLSNDNEREIYGFAHW